MARLGNRRQERFARLVAAGADPLAAYLAAGYSQRGARAWAARLLLWPPIAARVAALRRAMDGGPLGVTDAGSGIAGAAGAGGGRPGEADHGVGGPGRGWVIGLLAETAERALLPVPAAAARGAAGGAFTTQGAVALKALELLGREFGMFGGRGAPAPDATAAMSDAGLEERAVRLARELGLGGGGA